MDADDFLDIADLQHYAYLLTTGKYSTADIDKMKAQKLLRNEVSFCQNMIKCAGWDFDLTVHPVDIYLRLASALEKLQRREEAIMLLRKRQSYPSCLVSLSKLLFKANRNEESKKVALEVCDRFGAELRQQQHDDDLDLCVSEEDAIDAFNIASWVSIHSDNHTAAYRIWKQGSSLLPSAFSLSRQCAKRSCWDVSREEDAEESKHLVGGALRGAGFKYDAERDLEALSIPPSLRGSTPALALFDEQAQQSRLVFRTREPILTLTECSNVLKIANDFVSSELDGKWGTVRKSSVPTTDVAVEDIPALRPWLRTLLFDKLFPLAAAAYPVLADGSSLVDPRTGSSRLRLHDAFIVRYDEADGSVSLPEHSDTSAISFTVSLNPPDEFEGGGTWFEALGEGGKGAVVDAGVGQVTMFAGPLRHAGFPISKGRRVILVLFLYVEDFEYGLLLNKYGAKRQLRAGEDRRAEAKAASGEADSEGAVKSSGDKAGGYVVYRQTVELANMLEKINRKSAPS